MAAVPAPEIRGAPAEALIGAGNPGRLPEFQSSAGAGSRFPGLRAFESSVR